jgi:S1-C subfamily serine protease
MLRLPEECVLLVQRVQPGSPAEQAGVQGPTQMVIVGNYRIGVGGDLIMAIDNRPVEGDDALQKALTRKRAGDNMELLIYRNGRTRKVLVKLGAAPENL